jgi:biotin transport system substrate-specific component
MVVFYIIEGVFGLPVFSRGLGVLYLLGPTGGYILGFLVASYVCGLLAEYGFSKNYIKTFFAMIFGNLIIYFFGIVGLFLEKDNLISWRLRLGFLILQA